MKIGLKLVLIISAVNLVGIGGLTIAASAIATSTITDLAFENIGNITEVSANKAKAFLEVSMDEIRSYATMVSDIDEAVPAEGRRDMINYLLRSLTEANPEWVGVWTAYEPNALDGMDARFVNTAGTDETGRFISYWTNNNGIVSLDHLTNYTNAEYYLTSLRSGNEAIVEPYYETVGGKQILITSATVPIKQAGRTIGVAGIDIELTEIQSMITGIRPFGTGYAALYSNNGMILGHRDSSRVGRAALEASAKLFGSYINTFVNSIKNGTTFVETIFSQEHHELMIVVAHEFFVGGCDKPWMVSTIVPQKTVMAAVNNMVLILIIVGVIILAVITVIILIISRTITAPLKKMEEIFQFIGDGDFTHNIEAKGNDEIGNISRALHGTVIKIRDLINVIKGQARDLSDIGTELASNMNETAAAVNEITSNIQSIKGRAINQSASVSETNATMEQITANISKLNQQVDLQSQSVAQSSSAIEQMLANVQSVTQTLMKNMENVNSLEAASEVGRTGLQDVAQDIKEITRESEGLLEINAVMENIASQTNLLSMNAAIEAAHAGEAGKGFAVVAAEIRKLAEDSSAQSKTISAVLKKIKSSIDKITISTDNVLQKFEVIDRHIKTVADQEENIRNAMEEQGHGSKQILEAVGALNDITRSVKSESEEMRDGSKEVILEGKNLENATQEITGGMSEMATGADQINIAVNRVNELSTFNHDKIDVLMKEVAKFKVE
ncbi:MAG: methyl-accepting chemotaxis protein [Treponema sp.]|nr:methyl-accepting chemotaxis protein [Treponema sp.]